MSNDCAQRTNVSMYRLYKEITYSDIFSVHALVSSVFSCVKNLVFIVKGKRQPKEKKEKEKLVNCRGHILLLPAQKTACGVFI